MPVLIEWKGFSWGVLSCLWDEGSNSIDFSTHFSAGALFLYFLSYRAYNFPAGPMAELADALDLGT
jgi:hypothetical protein